MLRYGTVLYGTVQYCTAAAATTVRKALESACNNKQRTKHVSLWLLLLLLYMSFYFIFTKNLIIRHRFCIRYTVRYTYVYIPNFVLKVLL